MRDGLIIEAGCGIREIVGGYGMKLSCGEKLQGRECAPFRRRDAVCFEIDGRIALVFEPSQRDAFYARALVFMVSVCITHASASSAKFGAINNKMAAKCC